MEVRELEFDDLFGLVDIAAKATDLVQKEITDTIKTGDAESVGIQVVMILYRGCKDDLKGWIGGLCGKSAEEVGHLSLAEMAIFFKTLRQQEGIRDFFTELWALLPGPVKNIVKEFSTFSKPDTTAQKPNAESSSSAD